VTIAREVVDDGRIMEGGPVTVLGAGEDDPTREDQQVTYTAELTGNDIDRLERWHEAVMDFNQDKPGDDALLAKIKSARP